MNSGAEAVETAIKIARKYGYEKRGIPEDQAKIIVAKDNFHGRTTTIVSFSNDEVVQFAEEEYSRRIDKELSKEVEEWTKSAFS